MLETITAARRENGFTLLEILLTISVLTVGILAIASMQISATKGNALSSNLTEATAYMADRIEKLMCSSYASLTDPDGDGTNQDADDDGVDDNGGDFGLDDATIGTADGAATFTNEQGNKYNLFWNVAVDEPRIGAKTIRVIVAWSERGVQKRTSFDSIKANM
jgi:prepilin-type N-terminal cleavage/methylation domain-containing protein